MLKAIFAGPDEPNFMTLHEFRSKGFPMVSYTPKGGEPMDYDMRETEDFETIRNLIKNPPKGTTWRVLRYEFSKQKKTQKS